MNELEPKKGNRPFTIRKNTHKFHSEPGNVRVVIVPEGLSLEGTVQIEEVVQETETGQVVEVSDMKVRTKKLSVPEEEKRDKLPPGE